MDEQTETQTVRKYRHETRRNLRKAQQTLSLRTPETGEVYKMINGTVEAVIRGTEGLSQEQQVERLTNARTLLGENLQSLPEKVAEAKASVEAMLAQWESSIVSNAQKAAEVLDEAIEFAKERDFEAHQQAKAERKAAAMAASPSYHFDEDDDEDE